MDRPDPLPIKAGQLIPVFIKPMISRCRKHTAYILIGLYRWTDCSNMFISDIRLWLRLVLYSCPGSWLATSLCTCFIAFCQRRDWSACAYAHTHRLINASAGRISLILTLDVSLMDPIVLNWRTCWSIPSLVLEPKIDFLAVWLMYVTEIHVA